MERGTYTAQYLAGLLSLYVTLSCSFLFYINCSLAFDRNVRGVMWKYLGHGAVDCKYSQQLV